jgi:hypothetical protein
MYGNYRNSGIHRLTNYAEALHWHDNTPPIRGKGVNAGLRPLGHRNRMQFQIRKTDAGDVVCQCWKTDVVTFHPDGVVTIKTGGWDSQTTANFISDVLGIGAYVQDRDVQLAITNRGYYRVKDGIKIKRGESGYYEVVEATPHVVYGINRKKMNALRKATAEFRTYLSGMIKLREGNFEADELKQAIAGRGEDALHTRNWSLEINHWREDVSQSLPRMQSFYETISKPDEGGNWYTSSLLLVWSGRAMYNRMRTDVTQELSKLDDLLIATHPEVLEEQSVTPGTFKKNRYAKFAKYKELQR